jgi:hypothetical protein
VTNLFLLKEKEFPTTQTQIPRNPLESELVSLECWKCGKIGHRKATCPTLRCFYCGKRGHTKKICFNYKLAAIQNNPTFPIPQERCLENIEPQEGLATPCTVHPVNSLIEVGLGLSNTSKTVSIHSDKYPTKVLETQNTINSINPEPSSILTSNNNSEITFINQSLEPSKKINKFLKRKVAFGCNHCDIMLISQKLIKKHLQYKHEKKLKRKNYYQIPLWDRDQLCYLCKKPEPYYMSDAECSPMGNKLCIDCFNHNFEYNEDLGGSPYWLSCYKCKKKHEIPFTHGLLLETLCERVPEQNIIDIHD